MYNQCPIFKRWFIDQIDIWPFDRKKQLSVPRPTTAEPDAEIMSVEELYSTFREKQMALRIAVLELDGTITRSGFIDTSKGYVITRIRALDLPRYMRNADLKKILEASAKDARKQARKDRCARSAAEEACEYRSARVRGCAIHFRKEIEDFSQNMSSMIERRAFDRMPRIPKKRYRSCRRCDVAP